MPDDISNQDDTLYPVKPDKPSPRTTTLPLDAPSLDQSADTLHLQTHAASSTGKNTAQSDATSVHPVAESVETGGVAGYEILSELGRGGMGVVYKARQSKLQRLVALKMILSGSHAGSSERERFRREAQTIARLQHPHIVQIYEVGEQGGLPYFSMELIEGPTLQNKLVGTPQPARLAAHLIEILARTMHFAHQHGIIHRDLKPGNILLATIVHGDSLPVDSDTLALEHVYGIAKIMDFGLAKRLDDEGMHTRSGDLLGTPSYMAPEQASGKIHAIGPATDVYALGAILYELLTGRPPFCTATPLDTLWQVLHDHPLPPSSLQPKIPRDLERICLKCLEKEPHKRYASALSLAEDLRRHLNGEPVHARPAGPLKLLWYWCRRNPLPASLLIAVTLGSAFGFWYFSRLSELLVRESAVDSARQQSEIMDEFNHYYANLIYQVKHREKDLRKQNSSSDPLPSQYLPAPATVTIELGEQISSRSKLGLHVRVYSDYPFKTRLVRGEGGPRDDFGRQALDQLARDSESPFYRFENFQGRMSLRYATARIMKKECISCHNSHPDNTKHDWQEGDVRGILEIIRPLDEDVLRIQDGLQGTFFLVALIGMALLLISILILLNSNRRRLPPTFETGVK